MPKFTSFRNQAPWFVGLLAIVLSAACRGQISPPTEHTLEFPIATGSSNLSATPKWNKFLEGDTSNWDVKIVQTENILEENSGVVQIGRAPFRIRLEMEVLQIVVLNALDNDSNFAKIIPGEAMKCIEPFVLCPGTGIAPDLSTRPLFLSSEATNVWIYRDERGDPWDEINLTGSRAVLERDVDNLVLIDKGTNVVPIEEFSGEHLYLLFFVPYHDNDIIDPDELKKLTLELTE